MQFRIKERADGTWQWRLINSNGEVIANCAKAYEGKGAVLDAIDEVRKCAGAIVLESTSALYVSPAQRWKEKQRQ